ncbi:MAG: type VI secretion protein IcmF/TssM N-terminal domain-containing protein [Syntrophaceae bacterium]
MIKKILKFMLIALLILVTACLVFLLVYFKKWPWWTGIAILAGIFGIVIGILFLKKYLLRRKEKKFVQRVVELDEAQIKTAHLSEREQLKDLQERWTRAIELLRGSYLRKRGNPLYALPWYLVIGESGSGKTSAIKSAGLNSPLNDDHAALGLAATRNCDWWFFQEAIILDSAGRYTIPIDYEPDREEWKKFLELLARYRKKEPLNGIIVAIAADTLLGADRKKLVQDGQSIRQRIDQLMKVTGARFPVYIMVTKMDLVHGFTEFFEALPEDRTEQAMGSLNRELNMFWKEFLDKSFDELSVRLKDLRLLHANTSGGAPVPGQLIFPNEFDQLKPGLEIFARAVLEENPYQQTPLFRGIYYSSARQVSTPLSVACRRIRPVEHKDRKDRGFFLKEIFRNILPSDRSLFSPLPEFLRWSYLTSRLGLVSWVLVWAALCGLISFLFIHNLSALDHFSTDHRIKAETSGNIASDILLLDRMRLTILEVEDDNDDLLIPRFGIDADRQVETRLKAEYVQKFRQFWRPFYMDLLLRIEKVDAQAPEGLITDYMGFIVTQTKLLRLYVAREKDLPVEMFRKASADLMKQEYPDVPAEITSKMGDLFHAFLLWSNNPMGAQDLLDTSQATIAGLMNKSRHLNWLVEKWIPDAPDTGLEKFWGAVSERELFRVRGAYTAKGRKNIREFIGIMESVLKDKGPFESRKKEFWEWYEQKFYAEWSDFILNFGKGATGLQDFAARQHAASLMSTGQNPYFSLLDSAATEISEFGLSPTAPAWAALLVNLNDIRKMSQNAEKKKEPKTVTYKIKDFTSRLAEQVKSRADRDEAAKLETTIALAKIWTDYEKSLEALSPIATSREMCFRTASDYFAIQSSAADNKSTLYAAYNNFLRIKGVLAKKDDSDAVWNLVVGPMDYMLYYTIEETASYLQAQWTEQVLARVEGVSKEKVPQILFDKNQGVVWKFVSGTAGPFLGRTTTGYFSRAAFERSEFEKSIPFTEAFFEFLDAGAEGILNEQPEYRVSLETLPISVNRDAKVEPYANILLLQCADGQAQLKNMNYPQKKVIRWSPESCGDVTLQILFPDMTLTRTYPGKSGFVSFLSEFKTGSRTFTADDFPYDKVFIQGKAVKWIRVSYKISGAGPVLQTLTRVPSNVPLEIIASHE